MELLARTVLAVEFNGGFGGEEQVASMDIAEPIDDFEHGGNCRARLVGVEVIDEAGIDILAIAALFIYRLCAGRAPLLTVFLAQIALHEETILWSGRLDGNANRFSARF